MFSEYWLMTGNIFGSVCLIFDEGTHHFA